MRDRHLSEKAVVITNIVEEKFFINTIVEVNCNHCTDCRWVCPVMWCNILKPSSASEKPSAFAPPNKPGPKGA
jgi:nitrogen regulatory protein PII-like uncharacterized protein